MTDTVTFITRNATPFYAPSMDRVLLPRVCLSYESQDLGGPRCCSHAFN